MENFPAVVLGTPDSSANTILIVTQSWNGVINDHPVGVLYDTNLHRWQVWNQDLQNIPTNTAFNVWIADPKQGAYIHKTIAANVGYNSTYLDNMNLNNEPLAQIFVTPNGTPNGTAGSLHAHPIGVWYDTNAKKWAIFNQDLVNMATGVSFNVMFRP